MTNESKASSISSQKPPLREEVERTLRIKAWKDKGFRQELIADPKGTIERMFPECFPNGKAPERLIYNVIEEDQYTHNIVLPKLPDDAVEQLTEEVQLSLIANMGCSDLTYTEITCGCSRTCATNNHACETFTCRSRMC